MSKSQETVKSMGRGGREEERRKTKDGEKIERRDAMPAFCNRTVSIFVVILCGRAGSIPFFTSWIRSHPRLDFPQNKDIKAACITAALLFVLL